MMTRIVVFTSCRIGEADNSFQIELLASLVAAIDLLGKSNDTRLYGLGTAHWDIDGIRL